MITDGATSISYAEIIEGGTAQPVGTGSNIYEADDPEDVDVDLNWSLSGPDASKFTLNDLEPASIQGTRRLRSEGGLGPGQRVQRDRGRHRQRGQHGDEGRDHQRHRRGGGRRRPPVQPTTAGRDPDHRHPLGRRYRKQRLGDLGVVRQWNLYKQWHLFDLYSCCD